MARAKTRATTATTMMMTVCVLALIWMLSRSERTSSRAEPDGEEGGGGATIIGTATFSATVMVGACITVTARAAESAAAGCDVRADAAASTVAARLAVGKLGAVPAGGLGTVISACAFTDADEIRSRNWHGS
jgi:hypothetical protein